MAALLCILSPMSIAIGPIPVSLGLLGVLLAGVLLGPAYGTCSVMVFLLIGSVGLPVFSGGQGGFQALLGPTGGYLWSYPLVAALTGGLTLLSLHPRHRWARIFLTAAFQLPGVALCYALGTLQYCLLAGTPLLAALSACVFPFVPFDLLKCLAAALLGVLLREQSRIRLPGKNGVFSL